ncbi:RNA polymerase-associated protein RapA [Legionella anisa]|uniref:RNA polymerase-associated protein RapA n=1 Tax=Legionella anisa TaxID=28082 RepID=A0AAX0WY22_9GAMM|nr:RNA polymerase-associated protein RapA [Legionella anisa]AWN72911.1 RNA polymerase-associated protein RapA [Legionella anisa]KTC70636.1 RNA polymerase-associated protein HepA [Legionella anisa]MBN5936505.1 RNA polymerase-associated protein RapA [Legionella anisa]MCW8423721.1 RNA polymerase-associated protein RapA [Legionella anisa]MCW8447241.1 RNA polymerase-associated protein RapA [Legionella anisa]
MTFSIGQRWISNTETHLGLGIIIDLNGRQVSLSFPAADEERIYSIDSAPLSRIVYKEGEEITTSNQQKMCVVHVEERQGLFFYTGVDEAGNELQISELSLDCFIKLNTPEQRLFSGLLDKLNTFKLRIDTLHHASRLQQSGVRGLLGSRTSHLKHQVYIASEVAQRHAPRVLLADEVGLGKTIEAGMIIHYQLGTGRAQRILIVVPQTLIHQWLVEMIRRFNLYFSIIDAERYELLYELDEEEGLQLGTSQENLFENEQLVLCSLDFLMENEKACQQAMSSQWDLLVVDEAHHLHWSEEEKSPEYECIEELAKQSKGLLLLTATPEQAGIVSHFARLRLLDPSRFYNFSAFKKEEEGYQNINKLVQELMAYEEQTSTDALRAEHKAQLEAYLGKITGLSMKQIIKDLLDRHGTGRVLFRNTRAAIQGFPERHVHPCPLECPEIYSSMEEQKGQRKLYPEQLLNKEIWLENDPRVAWLVNKINELHPKKVLIICAKANTAIALDQHLKLKRGIRSTSFHEGLSIIERDRSAAYFAEQENGAQVLVCSEIGSEGRNFQFAHHLVLFDLPLNPDLLEQRIGRLDRIGQRHPIEIYVPYLLNTVQEKLFRWYHEGINLFTRSCSIGFTLYEEFENELLPILDAVDTKKGELDKLILETKVRAEQINQALHEGRDRLLELNSCNAPQAEALIAAIEAEENFLELENYMAQVFQEYGIDHEYHSEATEILRPTEHMKISHFPGLKEDGVTVTYSRPKALVREDVEFLSWEHPMVSECMEMILDSELGNATLATISIKSIKPGTLFLESFFTALCAAPKNLQLDRFLPLTPIRVLMDVSGKNLSSILDYKQLNQMCEPVKRHLGYPIIQQIDADLETMLTQSKKVAEGQLQEIIKHATNQMKESITHEVNRLEALKSINPSIREDEIAFYKRQLIESEEFIHSTTLKLQALRVVINKV